MLREATPGSVIVLHACGHNPTGCDPSEEEWREIGQIMKARKLFPLFDAAYLGFNSGSFDKDASSIRYFINELNMEAAICVSFAKNMGLYGMIRHHSLYMLYSNMYRRTSRLPFSSYIDFRCGNQLYFRAGAIATL